MLIIAIPKSASTSLLHSLGLNHKLPFSQDFNLNKKYNVPNTFNYIGNLHSDCVDIDQELVERWTNKNKFYKQHLPPTNHNIRLLSSTKKIILIRSPKEIILAYRRAQISGVHDVIKGFEGCHSENDWLKRGKNNGLFNQLSAFNEGWKKEEGRSCIILSYTELVNFPTKVINRISTFFNLESDFSNVSLEKVRYSKYNKFQRLLYKLRNKVVRTFQ